MLGLGLEREESETKKMDFFEERLGAFKQGERPNSTDEIAARRVWAMSNDGEFLSDREREFYEIVFAAREKKKDKEEKEIPLPVKDWSCNVNLDVAAEIIDEVFQGLPVWKPKKDHIRGREFELKDWHKMSETSKKEYGKRLAAIDKEIQEERYTDTDILCKLLATAHQKSRSSFYLERATIQRWAEANGRDELFKLVNSLPEYASIKKRFGERPIFTSKKTKERQRTEISPQIVAALMRELPPTKNQRFAPFILFVSGARLFELPSVKIFTNSDGSVALKIETAKLGCARKNAPKTRRVEFEAGSIEAKQLAAIAAKCGQKPFAAMNCATFRSNFRAAKKRLEKEYPKMKQLDIHSFRHAFATQQREKIANKYKEKYGAEWRSNEKLSNTARDELSKVLGHSDRKVTGRYGRPVKKNCNI
ncbi:hypothetical protein [Cloacibacillus porcorum]